MRRVVVVGPPGSGKTTVARILGTRLDVPHVELDGLWWERGWTPVGLSIFRERLGEFASLDRWVADGNYISVGAREVIWPRADTAVWLDFSRRVTIPRVIRRTMWRAVCRTELWSGNGESLRGVLRPDSIIRYAWSGHPKYNRRYEGVDRDSALAHLTWVRLRTPTEARRWLSSVPNG